MAPASVLAIVRSPYIPPVQYLTSWDVAPLAWVALAGELGALALYLAGVARLRRRGRSWKTSHTVCFVGGLVTVAIALQSVIGVYDDKVFVLHVIQHLLLMNIAAILFALSAPVTLLLQASRRGAQQRVLRVLHSKLVAVWTYPLVTAFFFYGTMIGYFLTPLYQLSLDNNAFHAYTHLHFLIVGCLFWWPVVGLDPMRWRMSHLMRLLYLFVGIPLNAFLGIAIANMSHPIAIQHTLSDTHAGGDVLWGLGEMITVLGMVIVLYQWMRSDEREARREDRRGEEMPASEAAELLARIASRPAAPLKPAVEPRTEPAQPVAPMSTGPTAPWSPG
ncbi:MAG: cytochrome c oxidase assembly protein [Acidimicrobiales bacterium]